MPPHTISPTPSSQGLGIMYSTMSPPPNDPTAYGFTGMGVGPKPRPQSLVQPHDFPIPHSPKHHQQSQQSYNYQQPDFQQHSPQRQPPQQYAPQQPLQQASSSRQQTFALRPTHTRKDSGKGFTSFSALPPGAQAGPPPSYAPPGAPLYQLNPPASGSRRLPVAPVQNESVSTLGSASSAAAMASRAKKPVRENSIGSTSNDPPKGPKRSRSTELFRKFSKSETISGGRYVPLSGVDDVSEQQASSHWNSYDQGQVDPRYAEEVWTESPSSPVDETASPVEITPKATKRPLPRQPSVASGHRSQPSGSSIGSLPYPQETIPIQREPSRSSTTSSSAAEASESQTRHSPNDHADLFMPKTFPNPPAHPPRSMTSYSDPSSTVATRRTQPTAYLMSRSLSQPLNLQSVPESDREGRESLLLSNSGHDKRASQVSTGIHSKNAALFSAESGGMMLAFSPSGDAVWREGELICGSRTGMIPTPQQVPVPQMASASTSMQAQASGSGPRADPEEELKSRPWSESTFANHGQLAQPQPTFLRKHGRSHSDGAAVLARQGTLFYPSSSNKRASQELGVMLGGRKRRLSANQLMSPPVLDGWEQAGGITEKVRLEASKKRKARVEVDVVLERECVVEGGEVRGRIEVRVTGGKRSEGLRIGGGKIRVIGFEEIASSSRHIFYHQAHGLPLFAYPPNKDTPRSSLFASHHDEEGYCLAAEGSHAIPFRMRLPVDGGAKGSYTPSNGKGPCVRYVVVGSIKIHIPSTGKRSIAHFYRQIVVLPYLNPAILLAPSPEPIEARVEKGLGWSLGGEKGRVEVRVALGRRAWVSGQRIWCEVGIRNDSTRKIKSLHLALLQTVQTFNPQPMLDTSERRIKRASMVHDDDMGTPDVDACQTSTTRRKVNEEVMEADFADKGAGRVTGKGWWTGVEAGEEGHWDLSILVPPGMLSVRRTRLIEVLYNLRVTVNGSIYVDVPVTLINFLSIDPPPMPSDGPRLLSRPTISLPAPLAPPIETDNTAHGPAQRMKSSDTLSTVNPAKASSTTLHLDALLQAGRARAEAEGTGTESAKPRPTSMMSDYATTADAAQSAGATPVAPPQPRRMRSYLSGHSAESGETAPMSVGSSEGPDEEQDKALQAARRAQGRQRSLAAISRAMTREQEANDTAAAEHDAADMTDRNGGVLSPMNEEYKTLRTPAEVYMPIVGDGGSTPGTFGVESGEVPSVLVASPKDDAEIGAFEERKVEVLPVSAEQVDEAEGSRAFDDDEYDGVGDETILDELVSHHSHDHSGKDGQALSGEFGGYDYAEEEEAGDDDNTYLRPIDLSMSRRKSLPRQLPQLDIDPRLSFGGIVDPEHEHIIASHGPRSMGGSFALSGSNMSENESEVGQVFQAVKRNMSIKTPSRLLPLGQAEEQTAVEELGTSPEWREGEVGPIAQQQVAQALLSANSAKARRASDASPNRDWDSSMSSRGSHSRRGSAVAGGLGMRRESSNPPVSSPLRPVGESLSNPAPGARMIEKNSTYSLGPPGSPLRKRTAPLSRSPHSPGISPRTTNPGHMLSTSPAAEAMVRMHSGNSALRHSARPPSASPTPSSDSEVDPPGLAASVASDSASSDGHLESPPVAHFPESITGQMKDVPQPSAFEYAGLKHAAVASDAITSPNWQPGEHMLRSQVNFLHIDPHARDPEAEERLSRRGSRASRAASSIDHDHDDQSTNTHETNTSILPGVRNKIAQLESRDEALRKFSVASIASNYGSVSAMSAAPTVSALPVTIPPLVSSTYSPRGSPSGRKSYTSALAPRSARAPSGDERSYIPTSPDNQLGGTTYIRPRQYRESMTTYAGHLDPFGLGEKGLQRNLSNSSTSTSATAIEAALAAGAGRRMGPRVQQGLSPRGQGMSPRSRDLPRVPSPARVAEETDESEGLL